jgi:hypothetical protein
MRHIAPRGGREQTSKWTGAQIDNGPVHEADFQIAPVPFPHGGRTSPDDRQRAELTEKPTRVPAKSRVYAPGKKLTFKHKLYSMDSTVIE